MDIITSLCKKYTDLSEEEIDIIKGMTFCLQPLANLEDADIFVDCPARDGDAIVVAEAKPQGVPSSYKKSVVGLLAKQENEPAVARTFRLGVATKQMKAVTQESTNVIQSVEPIKNKDRVIGVLIREKRVDDERDVGERIHFSQQGYEKFADALSRMVEEDGWLTEYIDEALIMVNYKGIVSFRNTLAKDLYKELGYVDDILGMPYENVVLHGSELNSSDKDSNYSAVEVSIGKHYLNVKQISLKKNDISFAVVIRDMTPIREKEKELILKSVAIKEMHHRVKNNLQTIASLLRLQVRRSGNEETKMVLGESMNRILSIATTHELLAQGGVDQVKIGEVIVNIKNNTVRYFASPHFNITISLEGDDFHVDSDIATSVALIINELLQNSLQYAFQEKETGTVRIIVTHGELYSQIEVIDNGSGFDVENVKQNRLGLSIVSTLVKDKLRGNFTIESSSEGTIVTFNFKNQIMNTRLA
ncbi:two-component sensor histidine kinase [Hydrogenoanaerobacterium saccharovorans]|uniref:histidine kinase n=1 Tax=Hydrogenoanaerobacterium saccharovorans TaxID=474960 RepID=A0A1H7ZK03_9FIRM|nr:sensor histidine kinase [Hydrogenoanaerobacterium saccharovorans]RPF48592.1 two-component sensor histidine kinase [Hydrogenoanaerobacterium saccharovorans]SEM57809.1 Two-component sensor histidine kinase, contains HisKA and HATPase domains [Hydrogenoanaerobacterium saccharovorans]